MLLGLTDCHWQRVNARVAQRPCTQSAALCSGGRDYLMARSRGESSLTNAAILLAHGRWPCKGTFAGGRVSCACILRPERQGLAVVEGVGVAHLVFLASCCDQALPISILSPRGRLCHDQEICGGMPCCVISAASGLPGAHLAGYVCLGRISLCTHGTSYVRMGQYARTLSMQLTLLQGNVTLPVLHTHHFAAATRMCFRRTACLQQAVPSFMYGR